MSSLRVYALATIVAAGSVAGAAACDGPTEARPRDLVGTYELRSIGGRALPWADTLNPNNLPPERGPSNFIFYGERWTFRPDGKVIRVYSTGYRTTPTPTVLTDTAYWVLSSAAGPDGGNLFITDSTAYRGGPLTFDYRVEAGGRRIRRDQYAGEWVWSR